MISCKINKRSYRIPTRWEDVTYRQYVALLDSRDITDYISIFTDVPREILKQSEIKGLEIIDQALYFLAKPPSFPPTPMVGPYIVPVDITIQSTGQFEDLRALLVRAYKDKEQKPEVIADLYLEACAIYCQKIRDGKYDYTKVPEMKEELKNYSCAEVLGSGGFFLFRRQSLLQLTMNRYRRFFRLLRNMIRVLPGYLRTLVLRLRFSGHRGK